MSALSLLTIVLCCSPAAALYEGRKDNKPVAELELMDDQELLGEIMSVCLSIAFLGKIYGPRFHLDGIQYAQVIERVSRKQHGGKSPSWMQAMLTATTKGEQQQCEQAHNSYIAEKKREKRRK